MLFKSYPVRNRKCLKNTPCFIGDRAFIRWDGLRGYTYIPDIILGVPHFQDMFPMSTMCSEILNDQGQHKHGQGQTLVVADWYPSPGADDPKLYSPNIMQRQDQKKGQLGYKNGGEERVAGNILLLGSFILFLSSPLHRSALLIPFPAIPLVSAMPFNLSMSLSLFCKRKR